MRAVDDDARDPPRSSLAELFSRLIADGETLVHAEMRLYRARAGRKALSAGLIAGLIGSGLVLAQAAAVALLIGILVAITPHLGLGWAIVIVVGGALVVAATLIAIAIARVRRLLKPEDEA